MAPFAIVGIGASAGGLAAISELLEALPPRPGMAFIIVSHMGAKKPSILHTLLAQRTQLPVRQAADGEVIEPNHVYVGPPGKQLSLRGGKLHATAGDAHGPKPTAIDHFFASLAADRHVSARGVVLSGTGSDGTEGLQQIRMEGGITFAQEPGSAQFDGMPASAVRAGCVDFVLPPAGIARELMRIGHLPLGVLSPKPGNRVAKPAKSDPFDGIIAFLSKTGGVDFSKYKESTLRRRIARRMALKGFTNLTAYLDYVREHGDEARHLYGDMLIHVSGFFRDVEAFRTLDRKVIAPLARRADGNEPIRIWVPGCARGEEVYSIGMLLLERLGRSATERQVQLFGSDISEPDIELARAGRFPAQIAADISPARLKRFFEKAPGGYQVRQELRKLCVFACHEVASDPPYSNLDLISCRNLLIYFSRPLQERVLGIFHYALKPGGILFLGRSESLAAFTVPFAPLDKEHHIYTSKPAKTQPVLHGAPKKVISAPRQSPTAGTSKQGLRHDIDRVLLERYAPPGFYVDDDLRILEFIGDVSPYLKLSSGQAHLQLDRMLPAAMSLDIRTAMRAARKSRKPVKRETDWVAADGGTRSVTIIVVRVTPASDSTRGYLVLFERDATVTPADGASRPGGRGQKARSELARANRQLAVTRRQLQAVLQEQKVSSEELRLLNEEAMSSNEELQSSNEELQTAKEELQSANEELSTVNEELQNRNQQLDQLSTELSTLVSGVNIPIVHLDRHHRVRRFSPAAQAAFNLIPADVGRDFSQIKPSIKLPDLEPLITAAIERGSVEEREVQDASGRWYSLRLRPFPSLAQRSEGALIALVDIDANKRNIAAIVATMSEPLLVLDRRFHVLVANPAFYRTFRMTEFEIRDTRLFDLGGRQWDAPELHGVLEDVLSKHQRFENFRFEHTFPLIGRKVFRLNGQQIVDEGIGTRNILILFRDATEEEAIGERLRDAREQEDQRIAHELHDISSGGLAGLSIGLARLAQRIKVAPAAATGDLRVLQANVQGLAASVHDLARRVHPSVVTDLGLEKALRGECAAFEDRYAVPVDLQTSGSTNRLPTSVALCVYRVLQEALRNIARHAGVARLAKAGSIRVRLVVKARELTLMVHDDGVGFNADKARVNGGLGLTGMSDRVGAVNGKFTVESAARSGTTITVAIPLRNAPVPPQRATRAKRSKTAKTKKTMKTKARRRPHDV
jgi:two-component system CheB/CheR fusion protein